MSHLELKRRTSMAHKPRKDVARVYKDIDEGSLLELLKQATLTLAILSRLEQKCFDAQPEARRIRALSVDERANLRRETLWAATGIRDELRRRMYSASASVR